MKTTTKSTSKQAVNRKIAEIIELYKDSTISVLLNDLVAIGTWPTPERLKSKQEYPVKSSGSVKIDTVPLPDRPAELMKLLKSLVTQYGYLKIKEIF